VQFRSTHRRVVPQSQNVQKSVGTKVEQQLQAETLRKLSAAASAIPQRQQKLYVLFCVVPPSYYILITKSLLQNGCYKLQVMYA